MDANINKCDPWNLRFWLLKNLHTLNSITVHYCMPQDMKKFACIGVHSRFKNPWLECLGSREVIQLLHVEWFWQNFPAMIFTVINAVCLIILGLAAFLSWGRLGMEGNQVEMLMPVFFGGALLICVGFGRQHYRHGLYGGFIVALLGVISAIIRIYQYEQFESLVDPKSQLVLVMGILCALQLSVFWKEVKKDRDKLSSPV